MTFPNNMRSHLRTQLLGTDYESFCTLVRDATDRMVHSLRAFEGALPEIIVVQRRYPSMSSRPIRDASMRFDPRTAFRIKGKRRRGAIRHQPEWLRAAYTALKNRHSNLPFQIGAMFPYDKCPSVGSAAIENAVPRRGGGAAWIACKPLIEAARDGSEAGGRRGRRRGA